MSLDFKEISKVPFKSILDWLNIPYQEKAGKLKGEGFIVTIKKNLYLNPKADDKGGIINFLSARKNISLYEAAKLIKQQFQYEPQKKKIPDLTLNYVSQLPCSEKTAQLLQVGKVKQKSIMAGKIAFAIYDEHGNKTGYIGIKDGKWFFPKNFKASRYLFNYHRATEKHVILCSNPFKVLELWEAGRQAISLLTASMSDSQLDLMRKFQTVLLIHPNPDNIINRLSRLCYVKLMV